MIVYNVARRWFVMKATAETYRKNLGLKPSATLTIEIENRGTLCSLLNALCEPPIKDVEPEAPATVTLVERAYVGPHIKVPDCVPAFLLKDGK